MVQTQETAGERGVDQLLANIASGPQGDWDVSINASSSANGFLALVDQLVAGHKCSCSVSRIAGDPF